MSRHLLPVMKYGARSAPKTKRELQFENVSIKRAKIVLENMRAQFAAEMVRSKKKKAKVWAQAIEIIDNYLAEL
jgi:hypothetical protein